MQCNFVDSQVKHGLFIVTDERNKILMIYKSIREIEEQISFLNSYLLLLFSEEPFRMESFLQKN